MNAAGPDSNFNSTTGREASGAQRQTETGEETSLNPIVGGQHGVRSAPQEVVTAHTPIDPASTHHVSGIALHGGDVVSDESSSSTPSGPREPDPTSSPTGLDNTNTLHRDAEPDPDGVQRAHLGATLTLEHCEVGGCAYNPPQQGHQASGVVDPAPRAHQIDAVGGVSAPSGGSAAVKAVARVRALARLGTSDGFSGRPVGPRRLRAGGGGEGSVVVGVGEGSGDGDGEGDGSVALPLHGSRRH